MVLIVEGTRTLLGPVIEVSLPWHLNLSIFFFIAQLLYHIYPIPFAFASSNRCLKCRVLYGDVAVQPSPRRLATVEMDGTLANVFLRTSVAT